MKPGRPERIVSGRSRVSGPGWGRIAALAAGISLLALVPGCRLLRAPGKAVQAITTGSKPAGMDPAEVAMLVQQLADQYSLVTGHAIDRYGQIRGTPEAVSEALRWKAVMLSYSMRIAGGYNPYGNLVDMLALISLNRSALEEYWVHTPQGAAFEPWLEASRTLETNVWHAAGAVFSAEQLKELRRTVEQYRRTHAPAKYPVFTQPLEFTSSLKTTSAQSESPSGILGFIGIDPLMGLDPAVQEVTRTRLFAERAMFTLQRMPTLMRLNAQILTDDLLQQPELRQTLTNTTRLVESADRMSRAVESASQTAAQLPDRLTAERTAILNSLEQQEGKLRELAAEVGRSLAEAEKMSGSLTITLTNFNALMKRFGVGEPKTNTARSTNRPPFKVLDYAETAARVGDMARELNTLISSVDQATPQVSRLGQQAGADARKLMNHAFRLGFLLILALLIGAVLAGLVFRFLAKRLIPDGRPRPPNPA